MTEPTAPTQTATPAAEQRRTIRRYAHEMYPPRYGRLRHDIAYHVRQAYAYAYCLDIHLSGWDVPLREEDGSLQRFKDHIQIYEMACQAATLCDAVAQGKTGEEAWAWATHLADISNGDGRHADALYERALELGVELGGLKPYLGGPEPTMHYHYTDTGNIIPPRPFDSFASVVEVSCRESECPACTVPDADH